MVPFGHSGLRFQTNMAKLSLDISEMRHFDIDESKSWSNLDTVYHIGEGFIFPGLKDGKNDHIQKNTIEWINSTNLPNHGLCQTTEERTPRRSDQHEATSGMTLGRGRKILPNEVVLQEVDLEVASGIGHPVVVPHHIHLGKWRNSNFS